MSIARKILGNTFFQIIGKIITAGLSIVIVKIITNYLGTAGYGQYTTVYEFLAFFGIIADLGIYTIAVREMSKAEKEMPHIIGNVLSLRTILALGLMLIAIVIAFIIPKYENTLIPPGIAIAAIATFFALLAGTVSSVLQVYLKMQYSVIALVISKLISTGYMISVIFYSYQEYSTTGFFQLLWAGVIGNFFLLILTYFFTRKFTSIRYQFDFQYWKKIIVKALPYGIALVLNTLYFRMDTILLSLMKDLHEVGMYGVAMRMLDVLIIIPVYFMNSVLPVMTRYIEQQNHKIHQLIQYSFEFLVVTGTPIVAGIIVLSPKIILLVSNQDFVSGSLLPYGADWALRILIFAMFFSFLNSLFGFTLVALEKQKKLLWVNAFCVIFNLISNLIVIPFYGFRGAAITSVLSELFILIATFITVKTILQIQIKLQNTFKIIFAGIIMGICVYTLDIFTTQWGIKNLLILIPTGGIVYGLMLYVTKIVNPEVIALLKNKN